MNCYHNNPLLSSEAFHELIQKRAAEKKKKTEQKRQEELRRIADMKSKSGVHPLNLFPNEIWVEILKYGNPEDNRNASQVHPMLQNLMESHSIRDILFPLAIGVILDYVKSKDEEFNHSYMLDITKSKLSPLMKLRQVSKCLKHSIDQWFEEGLDKEMYQQWNNNRDYRMPPMLFKLSKDTDRIKRLVENYSPTSTCEPAKTLFARSIHVLIKPPRGRLFFIDEVENPQSEIFLPFQSSIAQLLSLVGGQVLFFKLHVTHFDYFKAVGITVTDYYLLLQECCELMPNLERLEVCLESRASVDVKGVPRDLLNSIKNCPFPKLTRFKRLRWEHDGNIVAAPKIVDAIIKANPHVKMLKFDMVDDEFLERLSKKLLKALCLDSFTWYWYDETFTPSTPRAIPKIISSNCWPLKTLNLQADLYSKLNDLFKYIMRYQTLEKLLMSITNSEIGRNLEFLKLPNLAELECNLYGDINYDRDDVNFFFSLQFLLYAKKLKRITWDDAAGEEKGRALKEYLEKHECPENMVDFRGGMRNLKFSNIWRVFPELETVEVTVPDVHDECKWEYDKLYHRP